MYLRSEALLGDPPMSDPYTAVFINKSDSLWVVLSDYV